MPDKRKFAWRSLLVARAIENQCYVIGVNRVGEGDELVYSGGTSLINAIGEVQYTNSHIEEVWTGTLSKYDLDKIRTQLPFLRDSDNFSLD
jgi:omega-amidase